MSHLNAHPDTVGHFLQVVLENKFAGCVAPATVKQQQQQRIRIRVTLFSNAVPVPLDAVAGKFGCVARQTVIHMPAIANRIKDAVWNDDSFGPGRKVVIEGFKRFATADATLADLAQWKLLLIHPLPNQIIADWRRAGDVEAHTAGATG